MKAGKGKAKKSEPSSQEGFPLAETSRWPRDPAKEHSLVFSIKEQLRQDWCLDGPEPDFFKWVDTAVWVDQGQTHALDVPQNVPVKEREVWAVFHGALMATGELLQCYQRQPELFRKVAAQCRVLPSLLSWHPDTERANRALLRNSSLGAATRQVSKRLAAKHLAEQSWPVRYAYAIASTIDLTLDTYGEKLALWAVIYEHGVPHRVEPEEIEKALERMNCPPEKKAQLRRQNQGCYRILPLWTEGLDRAMQPLRPETVLGLLADGQDDDPGGNAGLPPATRMGRPSSPKIPGWSQSRHGPARHFQGHPERVEDHRRSQSGAGELKWLQEGVGKISGWVSRKARPDFERPGW